MSEDSTRDIILNALEALTEKVGNFEASMSTRLSALEAKQYDTRPIWEQALAELLDVKDRLGRLEKEVRQFDRKLDILNRGLLDLRADHETLADRIPPQPE